MNGLLACSLSDFKPMRPAVLFSVHQLTVGSLARILRGSLNAPTLNTAKF